MLRIEENYSNNTEKMVIDDLMCGDEANNARSLLQITYPMDNGIIKNWEDMENIWDYAFYKKMKIDTKNQQILLTEPLLNPLKNRENMCSIMFEKYEFRNVYVALQAILALYAQGLTSGVVIDSGDGVTHMVPVYDSVIMTHLAKRLDVAGRSVTKNLINLLLRRGYSFNRTADFETVRQIKERHCYISYDLDLDKKLATETTSLVEFYELPDGRVIKIGSERFEAPECLFQPHLIDIEQPGIGELLFNMIQSVDVHIRSTLFKSIVLSGGSSMYPGFSSRLEKELKQQILFKILKGDASRLNKFKIKIDDPPKRRLLVFIGGTVLASIISNNEQLWISKKEWEEEGPRVLKKLSSS